MASTRAPEDLGELLKRRYEQLYRDELNRALDSTPLWLFQDDFVGKRPSRLQRLRWRWQGFRERLARRAFRCIAGYDIDDE